MRTTLYTAAFTIFVVAHGSLAAAPPAVPRGRTFDGTVANMPVMKAITPCTIA